MTVHRDSNVADSNYHCEFPVELPDFPLFPGENAQGQPSNLFEPSLCLVSTGVSLSTMELSLVLGYTAILVPQLRNDPNIGMDKNMESWIASIPGLVVMLTVFMAPTITDRYGRRKAILISAIIMSFGWLFLTIATNLRMIIIGRILQGLASGISSLSGTILVAEYTSPKYRGAFVPLTTITMLSGGLVVHTLGSYFSWHKTAIFCLAIAVLDGVIVFFSPESPAFLARRGRFDECKKVFHWLRDLDEDEELNAMIKVQVLRRAAKIKPEDRSLLNKYTNKIRSALNTVKKVEFYKPLILMIHLEIIGAMPLSNIIAGEIFPLQYKAICALIIALISIGNITIILNTFSKLLSSIGLSGIFLLYSAVIVYAFVIALILLPETKDKTLQNIEERCWKKSKPEIHVKTLLDNRLLDVDSNKLIVSSDHHNDKGNVV
ncbi:uncharacterized protein LOC131842659 [Achroia grisella]|uniref:uncharacterized protein LOC131842659 n=1 Tax=Achroia grisella TaxID=688607 RepID=UPI0027D33214|nr:uncharacterized protein LOC131842659 [Achroia grisella]